MSAFASRPTRRASVLLVGLLVVVALGCVPRLLHPTADPLFGKLTDDLYVFYTDEGLIAHNARNRVLLGVWSTCMNNPMVVMPAMTLLEWAAFSTVGVGLWQARLLPMALAAAGLGLFALLLARRRGASSVAVLAAVLLLAADQVDVTFSHTALAEKPALFFGLLALAAWGRERSTRATDVAAGVLVAVACAFKLVLAPLAVAMGLALTWRAFALRMVDRAEAGRALARLAWFVVGGLAVGAVWALYVRHIDAIAGPNARRAIELYARGRTSFDLRDKLVAVAKMVGHPYFFLKHPVESAFALVGFGAFALRAARSRLEVDPVELVFALWLPLQIAALALNYYQPTRWFVLVGVPFAWAGGRGADWLWNEARALVGRRVVVACVALGVGVGAGRVMAYRGHSFYNYEAQRLGEGVPPAAARLVDDAVRELAQGYAKLAVVALAVLVVGWFATRSWRPTLPAWVGRSVCALALAAHVAFGVKVVGPWLLAPEYSVADARSVVLSHVKDGDVIASEFADNLFLDKRVTVIAFTASGRDANFEGPMATDAVTHVLVNGSSETLAVFMRALPHLYGPRNLHAVATFPMLRNYRWRKDFVLFERTPVGPG